MVNYVLRGRAVHPVDKIITWAREFETSDRCVAKTQLGDVSVSTAFLGVDHAFGAGPPLLFETMIFGGEYDEWMDRYSSYDDAEAGHNKVVENLKAGREPAA
jgi:hypothetical protein